MIAQRLFELYAFQSYDVDQMLLVHIMSISLDTTGIVNLGYWGGDEAAEEKVVDAGNLAETGFSRPAIFHFPHLPPTLQSHWHFGAASTGTWKYMMLVDVDDPIQTACSLFRATLFIDLATESKRIKLLSSVREIHHTCERSEERGNCILSACSFFFSYHSLHALTCRFLFAFISGRR